ncbi:unnamed protein product [Owenia fusiformis]|uniref:Phospholipid/glycerol acyltransferase domain-containing protein n=1 Tax=Owenia fusiformis TaxID=6347 RepID=A0A8S4PI21_OWEFU|nr:unnamed protein product [Owenia fusiformis]
MGVIQKICGFTFGVGLFLGSFLGIVFLTTPFLPLMILKPKWYRQILDEMVGSWEVFAAGMLELILGIKVVVTGDAIRPNERSLIVMNHRTRLDWMYLWSCLIRYGSLKNEKIILKSPLKHIPGAGWAMQCAAYIFINRKWETDKTILTTILNYFRDLGHNTMILIFPEGTDLTERTKKKSDEFAEKNNWEKYDHVLHPRTTGFTFLAELMRKDGMLDAIYDITVGYPYSFPQNETGLFFGEIPKEGVKGGGAARGGGGVGAARGGGGVGMPEGE